MSQNQTTNQQANTQQANGVGNGDLNSTNTLQQQMPVNAFYDESGVLYTTDSLLFGIINTTQCGAGGAGGPGYGGGPWADCVSKMGAWYEANIHDYGAKYSPCSLLGGKMVRHDCTGYVRACLQLFGCDPGDIHSLIMTPGSDFDKTLQANGFSLVQNNPYVISETAKPWDICSRTVKAGFGHGHAEIFAGFVNGKYRSWGWGNVHDTAHGGMPAGIKRTERYEFIWRKT